jgi:hypothetical protein
MGKLNSHVSDNTNKMATSKEPREVRQANICVTPQQKETLCYQGPLSKNYKKLQKHSSLPIQPQRAAN